MYEFLNGIWFEFRDDVKGSVLKYRKLFLVKAYVGVGVPVAIHGISTRLFCRNIDDFGPFSILGGRITTN